MNILWKVPHVVTTRWRVFPRRRIPEKKPFKRTLRKLDTPFFRQQFERSCVPDGPKVGTVSLSPCGDWRMPSDADPAEWLEWERS